MTRKRAIEKQWEARGLCGRCAAHPPIYKGGKCQACYATADAARRRYQAKKRKTPLNPTPTP